MSLLHHLHLISQGCGGIDAFSRMASQLAAPGAALADRPPDLRTRPCSDGHAWLVNEAVHVLSQQLLGKGLGHQSHHVGSPFGACCSHQV